MLVQNQVGLCQPTIAPALTAILILAAAAVAAAGEASVAVLSVTSRLRRG
jgi:hypothetical protein